MAGPLGGTDCSPGCDKLAVCLTLLSGLVCIGSGLFDDPANLAMSGGGNDKGRDKYLTPGPIPFVHSLSLLSQPASAGPPTVLPEVSSPP